MKIITFKYTYNFTHSDGDHELRIVFDVSIVGVFEPVHGNLPQPGPRRPIARCATPVPARPPWLRPSREPSWSRASRPSRPTGPPSPGRRPGRSGSGLRWHVLGR